MNESPVNAAPAVTVVVPAFNEEGAVGSTVRRISSALTDAGMDHAIVVVDDCSTDGTADELAALDTPGLRVIRHGRNRGYGAALKTGVRAAGTELVAITDADGTYPCERIPELVTSLGDRDMVVGARTGKNVKIPLLRRPAKWFIGQLASYLARYKIPDINSGLRVFKRDVLTHYLKILPDGFSFTTTITLALITRGHEIDYLPIDYAKRVGKSKIRPIRDTLNFVQLIIRTILLFEPLRIFLPITFLLLLAAAAVFVYSFLYTPKIMDMTITMLVVGALQFLGIGMIADMINRRLD
jgi:glycosyltransferase involved in cell wall biosynthesis